MFGDPAFDEFFRKTIHAMRPYLGDIICIGGCANALYRFHEYASSSTPAYIGTKDSDWAVPGHLPLRSPTHLAGIMKEAGFVEELKGTASEPIITYKLEHSDDGTEIEFLCPLSGMSGGRKQAKTSVEVQTGLMAQPLRYLDILTKHPWLVDLGKAPEFTELARVMVRVPNPAAYVVQKVLIRDQRRKTESKAKDCYYIYEVSVVFRDNLTALRGEYEALQDLPGPWLRRFSKEIRILFSDEHAEGPTSALDVYNGAKVSGPRLSADMIHRATSKLLDSLGIP